ncbi:MAG: LptA/OstA family protein [Nitrospiraceae bacterium]|nr:LptA/OstA family protein [Nitrospiraceae bacterium]
MLKRFFIVSAVILFSFTTNVFSEDSTGQLKGPIIITSDTLSADNKARTALFEKNVVAKTETMTLMSDKMLVYYAEKTGSITRIDVEGNVKLIKNDLVVTSDVAKYYADENKVVFTGEPKAVEKGNVVAGDMMTYFIKTERFIVNKSRVLLENKKGK